RPRTRGGTPVSDEQWYYDIAEGRAVQGKVTNWDNRMGPYGSRAEAEAALEKARLRNDAWDAQDDDCQGGRHRAAPPPAAVPVARYPTALPAGKVRGGGSHRAVIGRGQWIRRQSWTCSSWGPGSRGSEPRSGSPVRDSTTSSSS